MKKIFFLALTLCSMQVAKADNENIVQLIPTSVDKGVDFETEEVKLQFWLSTSEVAAALNFDIYLPDVFVVDGDYASEGDDIITKKGKNYTHKIAINLYPEAKQDMDGYNRYLVNIYSTSGAKFKATEGVMFELPLGSVAEGVDDVYPVYLNNQSINVSTTVNLGRPAESTSYIKYGNPTSVSLEAKGVIPSKVNEHLATETAITALNLSGVTASNGTFTYVAGRDVVVPTATVNADYAFAAGVSGAYASFCAPVNVTCECYTLDKVEGGFAIFKEASVAPANEPVLINSKVETGATAGELFGVAKKNVTSGSYLNAAGTEFHTVNGSATIPALRGCWEDAAASNLRIAIETPTGIQVIGTADEVFGNTYDLKGRQTTNAKNGVFVVNGKKQFVK